MQHPVTITPALNGFQVKVGCQTLVFESVAQLLKELKAYLINPVVVETRYRKTAINRRMLTSGEPGALYGVTFTNTAVSAPQPAPATESMGTTITWNPQPSPGLTHTTPKSRRNRSITRAR